MATIVKAKCGPRLTIRCTPTKSQLGTQRHALSVHWNFNKINKEPTQQRNRRQTIQRNVFLQRYIDRFQIQPHGSGKTQFDHIDEIIKFKSCLNSSLSTAQQQHTQFFYSFKHHYHHHHEDLSTYLRFLGGFPRY